MAFKVASQKDWLRGINAATGKVTVVQGTVRRISNLLYTKRGSLITVDGTKIVSQKGSWGNTLHSTGATDTPVAMIAATRSPVAPFPLVVALDLAGAWRAYDFSYNPPVAALSGGGSPIGYIASITINTPGSGYTASTQLIISNSPGSGFVGTVTVGGGQVTGVVITNNGTGYTSSAKISFFDPGGGTGAAGTVNLVFSSSFPYWGGTLPYQPGKVPIGIFRLPQLVNVGSQVVLCPGNDGIPVWANFFLGTQGTVGSNPAYLPVGGAAHGILHQGFLWLWNTGINIGVTDSPSTLRMCEVGSNGQPDITVFPQVNAAFVDANDGTQGQGMASFTSATAGISPTATLILFKDYKTFQVTGILRPGGGISITKAQTEMGCVAPRSIEFAPGFGIIRLTHLGVAVFDGTNDVLISEEIRPYLFQEESDIQAIDWERIAFAKATVTMSPPMYVLAVPIPNVLGNSRILCYDLVMKQWNVIDLPLPVTSGSARLGSIQIIDTLKIPGRKIITYISDFAALNNNFISVEKPTSQGCIRKWLDGDPDFDGVAIPWSVKPPPLFSKNPATPLYVRRNVLRAKAPQSVVATTYDVDGVQNRVQPVSKTFKPLTNPALYGSARYNSNATYGSEYFDLVMPFDVMVTGYSVSSKYSGSGPIEILASDWHYVEKPEMPYSRVS